MVRSLPRRRWHFSRWQLVAHAAAWVPLVLLARDWLADNLTANPIQAAEQRTGKAALVLLVLSLACTPAQRLLGWREAHRLRRPLGVYAFLYAVLHLAIFIGLDYVFDPALLAEAIFEKPFALVGLTAFLLLLPLALTSTKGWQRRLGRTWTRLHRLVYAAAALVVIHYTWSVKSDVREPLTYGAIVAALLVVRVPAVRAGLRRVGRWLRGAPEPAAAGVPGAPAPPRAADRQPPTVGPAGDD